MTLSSFIDIRPPAWCGLAVTEACTTVSTPVVAMTWPMTELRMSARMNSVRPSSSRSARRGGAESTPMTRSIAGSADSRPANRLPRYWLTPVTNTVRAMKTPRITVPRP